MKTILALLAAASMAYGHDVVSSSFLTYSLHESSTDPDTMVLLWPGAFGVQRGDYTHVKRSWASFVIPDLSGPVVSARITLPALQGAIRGRPSLADDVRLLFHDASVNPSSLSILPPLGSTREEIDAAVQATFDARVAAWQEIGSGDYYGQVEVSPNILDDWEMERDFSEEWQTWFLPNSGPARFELSPFAIRDINDASGDVWSIGVRMADHPVPPGEPLFRECVDLAGPGYCNRLELASVYVGLSPILELTYGPPPPLGDFDHTGRTDQGDLDFVLLNWGIVDQEELDAVLLTWGESQTLAVSSVPEPDTCFIAWIILMFLVKWNRNATGYHSCLRQVLRQAAGRAVAVAGASSGGCDRLLRRGRRASDR